MNEKYDALLSDNADLRRQIEVLIQASDDDVEVTHLYRAKHNSYEIEKVINWARECFNHPLMEIKI